MKTRMECTWDVFLLLLSKQKQMSKEDLERLANKAFEATDAFNERATRQAGGKNFG